MSKILQPPKLNWGATTPEERGPVISGPRSAEWRNVSGITHASDSVHLAVNEAMRNFSYTHRPALDFTNPHFDLAKNQSEAWGQIVSLDPFGGDPQRFFQEYLDKGYNVQPNIAVTTANLYDVPEVKAAVAAGEIKLESADDPNSVVYEQDGRINVRTHKLRIDPVWHLPGIAKRFGVSESDLRESLHEAYVGGEEILEIGNKEVLLPPMDGHLVLIIGDPTKLGDENVEHTARWHDRCLASDAMHVDICTCRPYLMHGIEECVKTAQAGGVGVIIYNLGTEGKGMSEVAKNMIYQFRQTNPQGDMMEDYYRVAERIAGAQDMRLYPLMPDIFRLLGVKKIDRWISMSGTKYKALTNGGVQIGERVDIPPDRIPSGARTEITAKVTNGGYNQGGCDEAAHERSD